MGLISGSSRLPIRFSRGLAADLEQDPAGESDIFISYPNQFTGCRGIKGRYRIIQRSNSFIKPNISSRLKASVKQNRLCRGEGLTKSEIRRAKKGSLALGTYGQQPYLKSFPP
jgi:hypothetical protein